MAAQGQATEAPAAEAPAKVDFHSAEYHAKVLSETPQWEKISATQTFATNHLCHMTPQCTALKKKAILSGAPEFGAMKAFLAVLNLPEEQPVEFALAILYDMLREDSSCCSIFEDLLRDNYGLFKLLSGVLLRKSEPKNEFISDKAAWLLSAVMGTAPKFFEESEVKQFLALAEGGACSELGRLDAIVNILKAGSFRKLVIQNTKFADLDFKPQDSPAILYKSIFGLWMLSYEAEGALPFKEDVVVQKLKETLTHCRVEKVVRLSLTCLRNMMSHQAIAEQIVESGLLDVVQQLEFEKWRDAELYDDIRDMSGQIQTRVQEMSNFDRYMRELEGGRLKWGFIHSSKFWAENVLKFEQNNWQALKELARLLQSADHTTQAVACHDLGEFVTMHPLGKRQIQGLGVKDEVMKLMSSNSEHNKELRREALLCCQKIMLNKWQDVDSAAA